MTLGGEGGPRPTSPGRAGEGVSHTSETVQKLFTQFSSVP